MKRIRTAPLSNSYLISIAGNIAAGKSTLTKALETRSDGRIVSFLERVDYVKENGYLQKVANTQGEEVPVVGTPISMSATPLTPSATAPTRSLSPATRRPAMAGMCP